MVKEKAIWEVLPLRLRIDFVVQAGWVTIAGRLSKLGEKIAMTSWHNLSPAAQRILQQKIIGR